MSLSRIQVSLGQLARYGVVGVVTNILLYLLYLALTYFVFDPKLAATIVYAVGVPISFLCNRTWTFTSDGAVRRQGPRYALAYALGYGANISGLYLMVDRAGWPHEIVQAGLIVAIAFGLFLLQKFWIFRSA